MRTCPLEIFTGGHYRHLFPRENIKFGMVFRGLVYRASDREYLWRQADADTERAACAWRGQRQRAREKSQWSPGRRAQRLASSLLLGKSLTYTHIRLSYIKSDKT